MVFTLEKLNNGRRSNATLTGVKCRHSGKTPKDIMLFWKEQYNIRIFFSQEVLLCPAYALYVIGNLP